MSSQQQPYEEENANVPRQKLEDALREMADFRKQFIFAHAAGVGVDDRTKRGFHAAVINCYTELIPYRDHRSVKQKWDDALLWETEDGWVKGLSTLDDWIMRTSSAQEEKPGRRSGKVTVSKPQCLEPIHAYRVSLILDQVAKELGIAIETDKGRRPAGLIDERKPETGDGGET